MVVELEKINFSKYDLIGITGIVIHYLYFKKLTELLKKFSKVKIFVGGPLATYSWEFVLKNTNVNICVIDEGEISFLELLNGKELSQINGIAYKTNNGIKVTNERKQIKNIDDIGIPAYHLFDMDFYATHTVMMDMLRSYYKNKRIMGLITSKGCPYNCRFCSKSDKGIRMKNLDFLFKEIEFFKNSLKIDGIHFVDELLLLNKKRFLDFCQRIKKYNIEWDCQGRINLVDEEILNAMKNANGVCI